ncbi:MAG: ATP-binding cassette domain-containing protein, partial [Candidatus Aminicenantes bacterium]|nr:ATP-binding cassette domain-containing protein [Candidatus Aminicenantes bacterium]
MGTLVVKEATKRFDKLVAVNRLSLEVPQGSMYGLLGPNGAGKTTTIRMIMNIIYPDEGDISIFGQHISEQVKDRIGYLPEERGLYTKMKVSELLLFFAEIKGVPKAEAKKRVGYWLERLELADRTDRKVEELSKGMQQKVQFISTVLHDPDLIIFDEPFMGLDPINTDQLKGIIVELKKRGKTIVLSTHLMEEVERLCEHICLINKGEKVLDGRLSEIKKRYGKNTVVLEFEGDGSFLHHSPLVK